jgi:hypothetical protein
MTSTELAKELKISRVTVSRICKKLGLKKKLINRNWTYIISEKDAELIKNLSFKEKKNVPKTVYIETVYYIYESKINNYVEIV